MAFFHFLRVQDVFDSNLHFSPSQPNLVLMLLHHPRCAHGSAIKKKDMRSNEGQKKKSDFCHLFSCFVSFFLVASASNHAGAQQHISHYFSGGSGSEEKGLHCIALPIEKASLF